MAIFVFYFAYNVTYGAYIWLFISEKVGGKGIATTASINFASAFIFGGMAGTYFDWFTEAEVFFILFFLQFGCIYFFQTQVQETLGCDAEARSKLYLPEENSKETNKVEMTEF